MSTLVALDFSRLTYAEVIAVCLFGYKPTHCRQKHLEYCRWYELDGRIVCVDWRMGTCIVPKDVFPSFGDPGTARYWLTCVEVHLQKMGLFHRFYQKLCQQNLTKEKRDEWDKAPEEVSVSLYLCWYATQVTIEQKVCAAADTVKEHWEYWQLNLEKDNQESA